MKCCIAPHLECPHCTIGKCCHSCKHNESDLKKDPCKSCENVFSNWELKED